MTASYNPIICHFLSELVMNFILSRGTQSHKEATIWVIFVRNKLELNVHGLGRVISMIKVALRQVAVLPRASLGYVFNMHQINLCHFTALDYTTKRMVTVLQNLESESD